MRRPDWIAGNRVELLVNGEQYFPRAFEAIDNAEREVLLETFIWFDDKVGRALRETLLRAARRGVSVDVTVDGWGSPDLSDSFIAPLTAAGVRWHVFDPFPRPFRKLALFRRMHRKLLVIDGRRAFVGGINYSADQLLDFGPEAKQDYSVQIEGPIVAQMHRFARATIAPKRDAWRWRRRRDEVAPRGLPEAGPADAMFVTRDNQRHTSSIEYHYRVAIRAAKSELIIANAYFFPGYRVLREMRRAARRGVRVRLIVQGNPDMAIVPIAARTLYDYLLDSGITVYEYCTRPLHGKVALTDEQWSTIGSSNLDPLSLSLNLEANLMLRDRAFNATLRAELERLMAEDCKAIEPGESRPRSWWRPVVTTLVFHFLRRFPSWVGWLPAHVPRLARRSPGLEAAPPPARREGAARRARRERLTE